MTLDPNYEFAPPTSALIASLLGPPVRRVRIAKADVADVDLAAFATGLADESLEDRLLDALIRSGELRERLRAVSAEVRRLGASPWRARSLDREGDSDGEGAIGSLLTNRFRTSIELIGGLRSRYLERGWSTIRHEAHIEARVVHAAIAAIGDSIRMSLRVAVVATVRGLSDELEVEGTLPAGVVVLFTAEIVDDGGLEAQATFRERAVNAITTFSENDPTAAASMEGRRLSLELLDPAGGSLPLGESTVRNGEWRARAEEFGQLTGLATGSLPSGLFRMRLGNAPPLGRARNHLYVELESPEELPVVFDLYEDLRITAGRLIVVIGVPFEVRRKFARYELQLFLPLGRIYQMIGSWSIEEWSDEARTLEIELPAGKDRVLETGSILRGRLVGPTSPE